MNMWVQHIQHLLRIAQNRKGQASGELQSYLLWYVLYLDTQASLSGHGSGEFVRAYVEGDILLPEWKEVTGSPRLIALHPSYPDEERAAFSAIYKFSRGSCILGAKLATLACRLRAEAAMQDTHGFDAHIVAARQRQILQLRNEFYAFWVQDYPPFLQQGSPHAATHLPTIARVSFEYVGAILAAITFSTCAN